VKKILYNKNWNKYMNILVDDMIEYDFIRRDINTYMLIDFLGKRIKIYKIFKLYLLLNFELNIDEIVNQTKILNI
jgi:hypothetical protein